MLRMPETPKVPTATAPARKRRARATMGTASAEKAAVNKHSAKQKVG